MPSAGQPDQAEIYLRDAMRQEHDGALDRAMELYRLASAAALALGTSAMHAESLRRIAELLYRRNDIDTAQELCRQSHEIALGIPDTRLAASALIALAGFELQAGSVESARAHLAQATELGVEDPEIRAGVDQHLGRLARAQGDWSQARIHYVRAVEAFALAGASLGIAEAYHCLGLLSQDQEQWGEADAFFGRCLELALPLGEPEIEGVCRLSRAEVHLARQRYEEAFEDVDNALQLFDRWGAKSLKAEAYRVLGILFRDTGRHPVGETRLRDAIHLARETNNFLCEAEAARELALLFKEIGRNQEALSALSGAHVLFRRQEIRGDLGNVRGKVARVERTLFEVARGWAESIESSDQHTNGHCQRVSNYAVAVGIAMGLDVSDQTTIRLGAYLHDVGKVHVPPEILNKRGKLSPEEAELMQRHPLWGMDLLESVDFPWDVKPMVRSHHEKYDGTGYPDGLVGEAIPVNAQIICIVDVYDALTTNRSYRRALTHEGAVAEIQSVHQWWRADVYAAFLQAIGSRAPHGEEFLR